MDTKNIINRVAGNNSFNESFDRDGNLDGFLFKGSARPELGFHFGYLMYLPSVLRDAPVLIIEGPSVGKVGPIDKACTIVYDKALFELSAGGFPHILARTLQCPIIMPLFPRPEDKENNIDIFTHALTSRAMSVTGSPIERIDLQLIAMFQDKFGKIGMPDRWNKYQELFKTLGLDNIEYKTLPGLDHRPGQEIREYIIDFLRDIVTAA